MVITTVMLTLLKSHLLLDQEYDLLLFSILQPATLKTLILQIVLKYSTFGANFLCSHGPKMPIVGHFQQVTQPA